MSDPHHSAPVVDEPKPSLFSNLVAIVGLIILIVVVIWGLIHLVSLSQGWFSSLFSSTPKITVTAPAQATSGDPFTVSWKYSSSEKGNYAFLYQCKSGLTVKSVGGTIPCGSAYTIGSATSVTVTPTLQSVASTSMPMTIVFLPSATSSNRVQGSATVLVSNAAVKPATQTNTNTDTTPTNTNTSNTKPTTTTQPATPVTTKPSSPADLSVRIVAIGVIDPVSGQFVNRPPMNANELMAAQFDIENVGGSTSKSYNFSANLPTVGGYVYNSPAQAPLAPGSHVLNTLKWSQGAQYGTFTVTVTGDGYTANNFASQTVGNTYYQPQPQYYPSYQY